MHTASVLSTGFFCALTLVGCTPAADENGDTNAGDGAEPIEEQSRNAEIVSSLAVRMVGDTAHLVLHVTNHGPDAMVLDFPTGQEADFTIERQDGDSLWQWSEDTSFTQATGTLRIAAGETRRFEAEWPIEGRTGDFVATGWITASNHEIRQRAEFSIPSA